MELQNNFVLANGLLNEKMIVKRENLYKGLNGRNVERLYLSELKSYVFKPLVNAGEAWVYEHILPIFPPIYPKILARDPRQSWLIFEDLGPIRQVFNENVALQVTKHMAWWHSLPADKFANVPLTGPKPLIEEIVSDILLKKDEVIELIRKYDIPERAVENIYSRLQSVSFSKKLVLSHGDLHLGNYGLSNDKIVVLDWENVHLNTPFWDLYHLIDLSHPLFPKTVTREFRERILECYLENVEGFDDHQDFKQEYYLFSSVFSIWMLLLIESDLNRHDETWPRNTLRKQQQETVANLLQCAIQN